MELHDLNELLPGLGMEPTAEDLRRLMDVFMGDFVQRPLMIDGLRVKVILSHARKVRGYEHLPETFVHLITRKGSKGERLFDRHRANKLHWIRCILEHRSEPEIACFKYPEADGALRDYFWYKEGDFLVIMERKAPDFIVITSFCVDDRRNREYFQRKEQWFRSQH